MITDEQRQTLELFVDAVNRNKVVMGQIWVTADKTYFYYPRKHLNPLYGGKDLYRVMQLVRDTNTQKLSFPLSKNPL